MRGATQCRPNVWLVGDVDHPDFADAVALVRATANVGPGLPELVVLAQSRPGTIAIRQIERLRRSEPLAGMVALLGSWCEGETRTGRPAAGVRRIFWYEFPSWWRRQMAVRDEGRCPEWARPEYVELKLADCGLRNARVAVSTSSWESAAAIGDVLKSAGCDAVWHRCGQTRGELLDVAAGIWEGGQLSDRETEQLREFCAELARQNAPVLALLDFPRRDRSAAARKAGAAAVLGKPWLNADLAETLRRIVGARNEIHISVAPRAA